MLNIEQKASLLHPRRWVVIVLAAIIVLIALVITTNCVMDVYGILKSDFTLQFREPNKNFIKTNFLLKNKDKYDSYLFGSSRINAIDVKKITTGRYYNMTYSEGVPEEHLNNVKFLLQKGVLINSIMVGLDDFSYRVDPKIHLFDLLRQPHPAISGKSWLTFFSEYFIKIKKIFPDLKDYLRNTFRKKNKADKQIIFDMFDTGRTLCVGCDEEIQRDPEKYRRDPKFKKPFHYDGDNLQNTLVSLQELIALTKKNNIQVTIFINPIHHTTYLDTNMQLFLKFKRELAKITSYYDFSGLNTITIDNIYYHETSHYRQMVGDMMLKRMFGYPAVAVPADFGILVNRQNVDEHLKRLHRQVASLERKDGPSTTNLIEGSK